MGKQLRFLLNLTVDDIDLISRHVGTGWKPLIQNMQMSLTSH